MPSVPAAHVRLTEIASPGEGSEQERIPFPGQLDVCFTWGREPSGAYPTER